jgi:hypothetical protein
MKHKRILWIACAVLFVAVLFFVKNKNLFESTIKYLGGNQKSGLTYDPNAKMIDLINKSTTGDGIPDWEKVLWGLDPTKTENVPGVPDSVTIAKLQQQAEGASSQTNPDAQNTTTNLTQTDQFSRELLATITTMEANGAIDQNGNIDQTTFNNLTQSLEGSIQNSSQRKIYTSSDITIINDDSIKTIKAYNNALAALPQKSSVKYTVMDVLQKFAPDDTGNNTDPSVLPELIPIVDQTSDLLDRTLKVPVPQSFVSLHLQAINALEGIIENLNDIQLFSTDPIVAFSGMSKYEQNTNSFQTAAQALFDAINKKLSN